jgi:hypothetical protein
MVGRSLFRQGDCQVYSPRTLEFVAMKSPAYATAG